MGRHIWQWPQMPLLEREKEIKADTAAVAAGAMTLSDINARRGNDWEETAEQRGREKKRLREIEADNDLPPGDLEPRDGSNQPAQAAITEPPEPPEDE